MRASTVALTCAGACVVALLCMAQTAPSIPLASGGSGSGSSAGACLADPTCVVTSGAHAFSGAVEMGAGARIQGAYSSGVALAVAGGSSVKVTGGGGVVVDNGVFGVSTVAPSGFTGQRVTFGDAQYCQVTNDNGSGAWTSFGDRSLSLSPYVGAPAYSGVFSVTSNRVGVYGKTAGILVAGWGGSDGYGVVDLSGSSNATSAAQYPVSGDILGKLRWGNVPYVSPGYANLWCNAGENWSGTNRGTECRFSVTPLASTLQHTTLKYGSDGSLTHYLDSVLDTPLTFESYRRGPTPGSEPEVGGVFVEDPVTYTTPNVIGAFASLDMGRANRHIANAPVALPACIAGLVGHLEYYQDSDDADNAASLCVCAHLDGGLYGWQIVSGSHCPDDGGGTGVAGRIPATARVFDSVNQTLSNTTQTAVTFDTEVFDTAGLFDVGTSTTKLTAPRDGYYLLGFELSFTASATGIRQAWLKINGTTIVSLQTALSNSALTNTRLGASTLYHFAAGDYVETYAYQSSGGNLDLSTAPSSASVMWMVAQ